MPYKPITDRRNTRGVWDAITRYIRACELVDKGDMPPDYVYHAERSVDYHLDKLVKRMVKRELKKRDDREKIEALRNANPIFNG